MLGESRFVLAVDWQEWLQDAVGTILDQLGAIGISATSELGEEGNEGYIEIDGKSERVKYVSSVEDDFDEVIRVVNSLVSSKVQYRKFRSCEGSDGWAYGLLSNEDWATLESNAPDLTRLLFVEVQ